MPRELVAPVVKLPNTLPGKRSLHDTQESHPAYAQIGCSRVSATPGTVLYGSDFRHGHYMTITIRRSTLNRGLNHDWPHGHDELIEVALSESQWASFVSTPNSGLGTQCTLQYYQPQGMIPGIPDPPDRTDQFTKEARQDMDEALAAIKDLRAAIDTVPGLSQKQKRLLSEGAHTAERRLTDSLPFVARSFGEHVERTTDKAKTEVHAYVENVIRRTGIEALSAAQQQPFTLEMPDVLGDGPALDSSGSDVVINAFAEPNAQPED